MTHSTQRRPKLTVATTLHLVIPGLLDAGPWLRLDPSFRPPNVPALAWLLAHATSTPVPVTTDAVLFELFGIPLPTDADLPVAAVSRLADGGVADDRWWWRADPVHFRPDLLSVFLADARVLAIEPAEAQALVAAFNQTFATDGLQLEARRPERWYLPLATPPQVRTQPLALATGRDLRALLPDGPAKGHWHKFLTEAQMLFHTHPVNRCREERGQPLISGIWLWGGGTLPPRAQAPAAGLYADDPLCRGLARLADAAISPAPLDAQDWQAAAAGEQDSLVVLETTRHDVADGEPAVWAEHVSALEQPWFDPCRRLLQRGELQTLHLYPGNGHCYTVTKTARWQFWRYPKPLTFYLS